MSICRCSSVALRSRDGVSGGEGVKVTPRDPGSEPVSLVSLSRGLAESEFDPLFLRDRQPSLAGSSKEEMYR